MALAVHNFSSFLFFSASIAASLFASGPMRGSSQLSALRPIFFTSFLANLRSEMGTYQYLRPRRGGHRHLHQQSLGIHAERQFKERDRMSAVQGSQLVAPLRLTSSRQVSAMPLGSGHDCGIGRWMLGPTAKLRGGRAPRLLQPDGAPNAVQSR